MLRGVGKTKNVPPQSGEGVGSTAAKGPLQPSKQDLLEPAPARIGGAPRPRSDAVELPALGGRPKVDTLDGLWKQLDAAMATLKPASLEAAIGALGALGFTLAHAKGGRATLEKGAFEVELEDASFGRNAAIAVALDGPKHASRSAVLVSGALFPAPLFERMREKYDDVLASFETALDANGKKKLPVTFDGLKAFIEGAKSPKAQAKAAAEDAQVEARLELLTAKLESMRAQGTAPGRVVIYTDGPDGAGKSSTGAIVMKALAKAGFTTDVAIFKAPTAEERAQPWLQRFQDKGVPEGEGTARFWDRGPAGDAVYGKRSPADVKQMAKELKALERELADDGVLLFKAHIFASPEKQAETFGKRLARQQAANVVEEKLAKRGELGEATSAALDNIRSRIDGDDFKALVSFDDVQARFTAFSKLAGYTVVDATDRHAARLEIIDALIAQLDRFDASQSA